VGRGRNVRGTLRVLRGDRPSDRRDPSSRPCVQGFTSGCASQGKGSSRPGKSIVKLLQTLRRRLSKREPARKHEARESGYGSSGGESSVGKLQGRERHERRPRSTGGHGERRGPKGLERAANQPKLSRGARTLRTAPTRAWQLSSHTGVREDGSCRKRGTLCNCVRGSKNLTKGGPARLSNDTSPS